MDVTTIKLRMTTKQKLESFRKEDETYDEAVQRLLAIKRQVELEKKLIEGYKDTDMETFREWETTNSEWPEY